VTYKFRTDRKQTENFRPFNPHAESAIVSNQITKLEWKKSRRLRLHVIVSISRPIIELSTACGSKSNDTKYRSLYLRDLDRELLSGRITCLVRPSVRLSLTGS